MDYIAAQVFLDEKHERPEYISTNNNNNYIFSEINKYNIVITVFPDKEYGIFSAVIVVRNILYSFPNIRIGLIVSISGGALSQKYNICLGDIVINAPRDRKGSIF
jgi:hypothetical protein